jgi:hypothetical protein
MDVSKEEQLASDRDEKGQEAMTEPLQVQLKEDRKPEPQALYEKMLEDHRNNASSGNGNVKLEGVTEKRLNDASTSAYPHRNEKAYKRTGEKRQINALPEELGNASDDAKRERYEKARKAQGSEKRILDDDVGSQLTNKKAFNLRRTKLAATVSCTNYISYKDETCGNTRTAGGRFAEVKRLDSIMSSIMEDSQKHNRLLTEDEIAQIAAMKQRKTALLGIKP